jgi:hypothetical protein
MRRLRARLVTSLPGGSEVSAGPKNAANEPRLRKLVWVERRKASALIARRAHAFARRAADRSQDPPRALRKRPGATASRVHPTCALNKPISGKPEIGCAPSPLGNGKRDGRTRRRHKNTERGALAFLIPPLKGRVGERSGGVGLERRRARAAPHPNARFTRVHPPPQAGEG